MKANSTRSIPFSPRLRRGVTFLPSTGRRLSGAPVSALRQRRGNALVLAAGILVLLVIIATAYISRTQGERVTSVALGAASTRDDTAMNVAGDLAGKIAEALFPKPIDTDNPFLPSDSFDPHVSPTSPGGPGPADANYPRLPSLPTAVRYGVDQDNDGSDNFAAELTGLAGFPAQMDDDGKPDSPYNAVPYFTVPATNWPDIVTLQKIYGLTAFPLYFSNPPSDNQLGNPGTNDSRWLRDLEPFRLMLNSAGFDGVRLSGDEEVYFTHWPHLTNIASAENGYRIVFGINDVGNAVVDPDGVGRLVVELNFPVEQWLPMMWNFAAVPPGYNYRPATVFQAALQNGSGAVMGGALMGTPTDVNFLSRWRDWFFYDTAFPAGTTGYPNTFRGGGAFGIPANLYRLDDLDGDGIRHNWFIGGVSQDTPEAEFIAGTARHALSTVLTDPDGDGWTDSFWFLVPSSVKSGVRTLMAVSIVDNGGMLDLSAGSRFMASDISPVVGGTPRAFNPLLDPKSATVGHTPADLALVGRPNDVTLPSALDTLWTTGLWRSGFFDNLIHQEGFWVRGYVGSAMAPDHPDSAYGTTAADFNFDMWGAATTTSPNRAMNFLSELGLMSTAPAGVPHVLFPASLRTQAERALYFRSAVTRPFNPQNDLTPFSLTEEIELRMFAGQNYPWIASRLEGALQSHVLGAAGPAPEDSWQILRANLGREESSEYLDQLNNAEWLRDLRRQVTLFNGVRNDLAPPWVWWRGDVSANTLDDDLPLPVQQALNTPGLTPTDLETIRRQYRDSAANRSKLDLREALRTPVQAIPTPAGNIFLSFRDRLVPRLTSALIERGDPGNPGDDKGYFDAATMRSMTASFAANFEAYRDFDDQPGLPNLLELAGTTQAIDALYDPRAAVLVDPDLAQPATLGNPRRFVGLEQQPFILEAFIGHVYAPAQVDQPAFNLWATTHVGPTGPCTVTTYPAGFIPFAADGCFDFGVPDGQVPFVDSTSEQTTVVAVQIANPFTDRDESGLPFVQQGIDLRDYAIRVFGKIVKLETVFASALPEEYMLRAATEEKPRTAIFYSASFPSVEAGFGASWADFFDLENFTSAAGSRLFIDPNNPLDHTLVKDVTGQGWSQARADYDSFGGGLSVPSAIELLRKLRYPGPDGQLGTSDDTFEWLVVDRTNANQNPNSDDFTSTVKGLAQPPVRSTAADWSANTFNGVRLSNIPTGGGPAGTPFDRWVTWARVARPWGWDFNFSSTQADEGDIGIQPQERAPRFVIGHQFVTVADRFAPTVPAPTTGQTSDRYNSADGPDDPWFRRIMDNPTGSTEPLQRKPTFFTCNPVFVAPAGSGMLADDAYPAFNDPNLGYGKHFTYIDSSSGAAQFVVAPQAGPAYSATNPPPGVGIPGKGLRSGGNEQYFPRSLQMLQKDGDFEQVGEIMNVWVWGHELPGTSITYLGLTEPVWKPIRTFSEYMRTDNRAEPPGVAAGERPTVRRNRLQYGPVIGQATGTPGLGDASWAVPDLPAGLRVLDAFVCDGPGLDAYTRNYPGNDGLMGTGDDIPGPALNVNGTVNQLAAYIEAEKLALRNAQGFTGKATPGLVNVSTATPEVMRSLPQFAGLVNELYRLRSVLPVSGTAGVVNAPSEFERFVNFLPEAIVAYRDRSDGGIDDLMPRYAGSTLIGGTELMEPKRPTSGTIGLHELDDYIGGMADLRPDRGMASIGEMLMAVNRPRDAAVWGGGPYILPTDLPGFQARWTMDMPGRGVFRDPFSGPTPTPALWTETPANQAVSAALSTDVSNVFDNSVQVFSGAANPGQMVPDKTGNDAEELNMLFAGASNLVTTHSDMFTVYFRIRSFKQDAVTGVWDATRKENIVDDSRYVMLVDRSECNKPGDKPKILYLEKLPR